MSQTTPLSLATEIYSDLTREIADMSHAINFAYAQLRMSQIRAYRGSTSDGMIETAARMFEPFIADPTQPFVKKENDP